MAGLALPRWLFSWLRHWFSWRVKARRRSAIRFARPSLTRLEDRLSPTSLAPGSAADPPPPADLGRPAADSRPARDEGVTPGEPIRLILPAPARAADGPAAANEGPKEEPSFVQQFLAGRDTAALDNLFSLIAPPPNRRSAAPTSPANNAPNPQALAGGALGAGGPSTPNAGLGGGGGGGGGGGAGPAVTNANQWLTAYLGMAGSAFLTPAPAAGPMLPPASITPAPAAGHTPPGHSTPGDPLSYKMTAPKHDVTEAALAPLTMSGSTMMLSGPPVLDMNNGETLPTSYVFGGQNSPVTVPLNTFSTWGEHLLAQSTGTLVNYTWDLSGAPDLTGVSVTGALGGDLQGTWAAFTGAPRTDVLSVTEHFLDGTTATTTMTFQVAGTDSPGFSSARPTGSATWPDVLTPDMMSGGQSATWPDVLTPDMMSGGQAAVAAGPWASAGPADGSVQTAFAMPSYGPGAAPFGLIYNSVAADPQPIFLVRYPFDSTPQPGDTIALQLTLNGTPGPIVYYGISSYQAGDWGLFALQADASALSTGRYSWTIGRAFDYTPPSPPSPLPVAYSGKVDVVNEASSPYGAGWAPDGVERLIPTSDGAMVVNPDGTSLFFSGGSYSPPPGDFSSLTGGGGGYTRTLPDGTKINFNGGGQQTSVVDTDGNTTTYSYTGGLLTGITDPEGQTTTLSYGGGQLASVADPAGRTATMAYSGNHLTSITDPGGGLWQYGYDSAGDLTSLTDPDNASNGSSTYFSYNFGRLSTVMNPDNTFESLTPEQELVLGDGRLEGGLRTTPSSR